MAKAMAKVASQLAWMTLQRRKGTTKERPHSDNPSLPNVAITHPLMRGA
jgi:hypothetical protein